MQSKFKNQTNKLFMKLIKLVQRAKTVVKYQGNKNKFNQNKHKLLNLKRCSKFKKQQTINIVQDIKVKKF